MPHRLTHVLPQVPRDIEIAQAATPIPIDRIAAETGILPEELELYGKNKAKVHLSIRDRLRDVPDGHYWWSRPLRPLRWARAKRRQQSG